MHRKITFLFCLLCSLSSFAQRNNSATAKSDVEYDLLYDEPYDLQKMWLQIMPLYVDYFSTNLNVGYGLRASYYLKEKMNFQLQARRAYAQVTDFARSAGQKNKITSNKLTPSFYLEGGGTYHISDKAGAGNSRMVIYTRRYSYDKWAATVPEHVLIPSKIRHILGARLGGYFWNNAINLSDVTTRKNLTLTAAEMPTDTLPETRVYTNIQSAGIYLGGSFATIRNVAIKPKKYDAYTNDVIFTLYADIIYAPFVKIENPRIRDEITKKDVVYDAAAIPVKNLGFRLGFDGMYNRDFGWSWGGELGYRPSVQGRSFFVTARVAFAIGTRFDQKRTATQIVKPAE
jgi:hypothetical protein